MHLLVNKMKSILEVLTVVAAIFELSHCTKIQKCDGDDAPEVATLRVQIGNCGDERCVLERGKTYNFMVKFKAAESNDNVTASAFGSAHGFQLELKSGSDNEACKSIQRRDKKTEKGKACPLEKGTYYMYDKDVRIEDNEFRTRADVEWYLHSGDDIFYCFKVPVEVK